MRNEPWSGTSLAAKTIVGSELLILRSVATAIEDLHAAVAAIDDVDRSVVDVHGDRMIEIAGIRSQSADHHLALRVANNDLVIERLNLVSNTVAIVGKIAIAHPIRSWIAAGATEAWKKSRCTGGGTELHKGTSLHKLPGG